MKRLKGICLAVLTVVLSVAMLMGTLTLSAFAADNISNITTNETNPATFAKRVKYGVATDKFKGATKIVTPNGTEIKKEDAADFASYTPMQLGVYTVYYGDNYSYNVSCYLTGEYELRVENNGADIATYTEVTTDAATENNLTLPKAAVWFKGEDADDFKELTADNVKDLTGLSAFPAIDVSIIGPQNFSASDLQGKTGVKLTKLGTYTVRYSARVGGANGTKYLSKDYTAKVQAAGTVNDTAIPSLSVVNVPSTLSLNTKVTLPKATATDNYDENVKVTVKVEVYDKDFNGGDYRPVREPAAIDEKTGYAKGEGTAEVQFDNEYNLSFYPVLDSTYRITYQAIDDKGNKTADTGYVFTATASDRTAPVLQKIDDWQIPGTWGMKMVRNVKEGETPDTDGGKIVTIENPTLSFPVPEYEDNSGKENVLVSVEIKDTTNNYTVARFENIFDKTAEDAAGDNAKYAYDATKASNGIYDPYINDAENAEKPAIEFKEFALNFELYQKALRKKLGNDTVSAAGNYTVTYRAQDKTPNIVTKTYDIVLQETYTDTDAPNISDLNWGDNYLVFTDEEESFTIPTPELSDSDSNLQVVYKLFAGSSDTGIEVKGGETATLQLVESVPTLTVKGEKGEADKTLTFASGVTTLEYAITATDDAGNVTVKTNGENRGATEDADDVTIDIVTTEDLQDIEGLHANKITFTPATLPTNGMVPGVSTPVGDIEVTLTEGYRAYHGFEISLYTVDGSETKEWKNGFVSLETYYTDGKLHIDHISFAAPKVDKVIMYVRIYDVAGRSFTFSKDFAVDTTTSGGDGSIQSALNIGTSGNVYTSYILKNREVKESALGSDYKGTAENKLNYIKRKIEGTGKFSLTGGYLFTAYNAGTFTFGEYYYAGSEGANEIWKPIDKSGSYDWTVTETSTPVWQMQGVMPTYTPLKADAQGETPAVSGEVVLPHVVASSEFANAKITLSVEFSPANGSTRNLTVAKDAQDTAKDVKMYADNHEHAGQYYFTATQDGTYTVKYTATYGDNAHIEQTFTIRAGDITAPSFTVSGTHAPTATENSRFKFNAINALTDEQETANLRYTKTLEAPDGSTVFTVEGTGESYRTATVPSGNENKNGYKFTKTGVYTVRYKVADRAGNESVTTYTITVTEDTDSDPTTDPMPEPTPEPSSQKKSGCGGAISEGTGGVAVLMIVLLYVFGRKRYRAKKI